MESYNFINSTYLKDKTNMRLKKNVKKQNTFISLGTDQKNR